MKTEQDPFLSALVMKKQTEWGKWVSRLYILGDNEERISRKSRRADLQTGIK